MPTIRNRISIKIMSNSVTNIHESIAKYNNVPTAADMVNTSPCLKAIFPLYIGFCSNSYTTTRIGGITANWQQTSQHEPIHTKTSTKNTSMYLYGIFTFFSSPLFNPNRRTPSINRKVKTKTDIINDHSFAFVTIGSKPVQWRVPSSIE